jgi:aminoglycoside phosphotransferase (APT) family kinase protein
MNKTPLKLQWERSQAPLSLNTITAAKLLAPYTQASIAELLLLTGGCANTNYKVTFQDHTPPLVIRFYMRDQSALERELAIHKRVATQVPAPHFFYTDPSCALVEHPYALIEWKEGLLMCEAILSPRNEKVIADCSEEAGKYLGELRKIKFPHHGFFQAELKIRPSKPEEEYLPFVLTLLQDKGVQQSLGKELLQTVENLVSVNASLLKEDKEANLTHADYNPANILVKETQTGWKITAILDWEFSFAGSYLLDLGTMLRYAHTLPSSYEKKLIQGLIETSGNLPTHWKKQAKLMDLLCLLDLIQRNPKEERPQLTEDVILLIANTCENWNKF